MIGAFLLRYIIVSCIFPPSYVVKGSLHYIDFVRQEKVFIFLHFFYF